IRLILTLGERDLQTMQIRDPLLSFLLRRSTKAFFFHEKGRERALLRRIYETRSPKVRMSHLELLKTYIHPQNKPGRCIDHTLFCFTNPFSEPVPGVRPGC